MARKSRKQNADSVLTNILSCQNKTAVYVRLSMADNGNFESSSIETQQDYVCSELEKYTNINIIGIYKDNGFSGTNFNRCGWEQLIADIKAKKVNCIAVKDFSRLGRNAVEVGNYLEMVFPFLGVRFISINDNYDSSRDDYYKTIVETSFKNIINELYVRDISRKVKSGITARRNLGYIHSGNIAYGYKKSSDNRSLVLDENTAPVVRKIFEWRMQGKRLYEIINILNTLAIPSPGKYQYILNNGFKYTKYANASWSFSNIRHILADKTYTGVLIQGKTTTSVFEGKKKKTTDESQWIVRENAHPALVSKTDFQFIQDIEKKDFIEPKNINPLKDKVICGLCGYKMIRSYKPFDKSYHYCKSHKTQLKGKCHNYIIENDIKMVVSETLKKLISVLVDKSALADEIRNSRNFKDLINKRNNEIRAVSNHILLVNSKIKDLYNDLKSEVVSEQEFVFIKDTYSKELAEYNARLQNLIAQNEKIDAVEVQTKRLNKLLKDLDKITDNDEYLYSLVNSITVYPEKRLEIEFAFTDSFSELLSLGKEELL